MKVGYLETKMMDSPEPVPELVGLSIEDEDRMVEPPMVRLKNGIDLNELKRADGEGAEFEISTDETPHEIEQFDSAEMFKQLNYDCTNEFDDDSDDDTVTPFERIARDMKELTVDKGVLKKMIKGGMGEFIPPGSHCKVHYNAYLEYSDEPYDSTRLRRHPQVMKLGDGICIPGFEICVGSMRKGEMSKYLIKPEYAYGKHGCPPRIPGNATILMEIELVSFIDDAITEEFHRWTKEEQKRASFDEILAVVNGERKAGNELYQQNHIGRAFSRYNKGHRILESCTLQNEEEEKKMEKTLLRLYLNMALCSIKLRQSARAITFCKKALEIDSSNVKALFRHGQALHQLSDFDRAKQCLVKVQKIEPHNEEITRELRKLDVSVKKFRELEKDLYGRMFAKNNNKATAGNGDAPKVTLKECSQEFQKQVTETLSNFKDMDIQEMPLSVVSFTPSEIDYVTKCAAGMDFDIKYTGPKSERFMKIIKRSEAE